MVAPMRDRGFAVNLMAREWALGEKAESRDYSWSGTPPFPSPPFADGPAAP